MFKNTKEAIATIRKTGWIGFRGLCWQWLLLSTSLLCDILFRGKHWTEVVFG